MSKEEIKAIDQIPSDRSFASLKQIIKTCSFIDLYFRAPSWWKWRMMLNPLFSSSEISNKFPFHLQMYFRKHASDWVGSAFACMCFQFHFQFLCWCSSKLTRFRAMPLAFWLHPNRLSWLIFTFSLSVS